MVDLAPQHPNASQSEGGFWRDEAGAALSVSASDLERHEYCPMSWSLSRQGNSGQGEAIKAGVQRHAKIHQSMKEFNQAQVEAQRSVTIWTWWFSVIIAFCIDAVAFQFIDEVVTPLVMARYLALWALTTLLVGMFTISFPWRSWIGMTETVNRRQAQLIKRNEGIESTWQPKGFIGGWFEAGRIEASLLCASIVLGLHAIALRGAQDRNQATFILFITAMTWTLAASWQLQRVLLSNTELQSISQRVDLEESDELAYSDDDESSNLLMDRESGLRGRPDQIVIVDGEFIPVEQKTGRTPAKPHSSHRLQLLAYLHLVEKNTGKASPYGVLRYGKENLHQIPWTEEAKEDLFNSVKEIQRLMVVGGAKRNHERPGKCQNCSRRYACNQSLV